MEMWLQNLVAVCNVFFFYKIVLHRRNMIWRTRGETGVSQLMDNICVSPGV